MTGPVALGWNDEVAASLATAAGRSGRELIPGRVVIQQRDRSIVAAGPDAVEVAAVVSGRFRHAAAAAADFPAVGDWVGPEPPADGRGLAVVQAVLPRRSAFVRRAAGSAVGAQVVAANVDVVLLATSLDEDLNPRRLERYLAVAWESGAQPRLLLTKADRCPDEDDLERRLASVALATGPIPWLAVSARTGQGLAELTAWFDPARTVALLGSSGVGKSTLINRLVGAERQVTRPVRAGDSRGRHATVRRELVRLPGGGLVVDTPGLRELGIWEGDGLGDAFGEVERLAEGCRFRDCRHRAEPGCAMRAAVAEGRLDPARLGNRRKLREELAALDERRAGPGAHRRFWRSIRDASKERLAARSDPSLGPER